MKTFDFAELDRRFPQILEAIGWTAARNTHGHLAGPCPIHHGTDANFHLDQKDDGRWIAICRSQCGSTGWTSTQFVAAYFGVSHGVAIAKAAELGRVSPTGELAPKPTRQQRSERAAQLTRHQTKLRLRQKQQFLSKAIARKRDADLQPYISHDWREEYAKGSLIPLPNDFSEQAKLMLLSLFAADDILWLGNQFDSGKPRHSCHFRRRDEWLKAKTLPPRIAAGTFREGSISRCSSSLLSTPFIVIESDDLIGEKPLNAAEKEENKAKCAALFAFLADQFQLNLRAVVDTGNRSLHGWFDRPSHAAVSALVDLANALAIDAPVITEAQRPLRLPGCLHDATSLSSHLCYLSPNPCSK